MQRSLRVAALQLKVTLDRADTLRRARDLIDRAAREGCELVSLPECFAGKYGVQHFAKWQEVLPTSPTDADANSGGAAMLAEAASQHGIILSGGVIEREPAGKRLFNTMPVYGRSGELLARYRKVHLSRVLGITSEADVLTAGSETSHFPVRDNIHAGLACCFDLRFPTWLARYGPHAAETVDVLLAPSAFLDVTGRDHWHLLCRRAALDLQCFVVAPNIAFDSQDEVPLYGHSIIVDPWGRVLAECGPASDDLAIADLDGAVLDDVRAKLPLGAWVE